MTNLPVINLDIVANKAKLVGDLHFSTVMTVLAAGKRYIADQQELVFDCSEVKTFDSAGLALLVLWYRAAIKQNKKIHFQQLPASLQPLLEITGIKNVIKDALN